MKQPLIVGIFLIWMSMPGNAGSKLAPDLVVPSGDKALDVIVQFTSTPTERHHDKIRRRGGELKHDLRADATITTLL